MAQQREGRLVNEYLREFYPTSAQWKRIRLGAASDPTEARMHNVTLRWADAVVDTGDEIIIIEAKIKASPGVLAQLELYDDLFGQTPEFSQHWEKPRRLVVLAAAEDADVRRLAHDKGMEFVLFRPEWIKEYLFQRFNITRQN